MAVLGRFLVAALAALAMLALVDLLGEAVAGHAGAFGGGGLMASLPGELGRWLVPPPQVLWSTTGLVGLGALAALAAALSALAARLGAARPSAALVLLVGLVGPLSIWNPLGLFVLAGQAMGLAVIAMARGAPGGRAGEETARILGLAAAVLLTLTTPPALVVTLLAVALAPGLLAALTAPAEGRAAVLAPGPDGASGPARDGALPPASSPASSPALSSAPPAGPFGPDPVAAHDHLMPAIDLIAQGRAALRSGTGPVLLVARLDGLAGIAGHLGAAGGAALFTEASGRLAGALPADCRLAWIGDETFAALLPAATAADLETLELRMAEPFAMDLHVDGRTVSMEDALHIDATTLDAALLDELARQAGLQPGA